MDTEALEQQINDNNTTHMLSPPMLRMDYSKKINDIEEFREKRVGYLNIELPFSLDGITCVLF